MPRTKGTDSQTVPAILLAAGASTRLGRPKQLLRLSVFDGEALLERMVRIARKAGTAPILVVLGAHAEAIQREITLQDCILVRNGEWQEGMASSVRAGIRAILEQIPHATGALLMVCDQPALTAEHLQQLLEAHRAAPMAIVASRYADRSAVPAIVPCGMFPSLLQLTGDSGARAVLQQPGCQRVEIPFPSGEWDIDDGEDLQRTESELC